MASLFKDARTGIYQLQFHDATRTPTTKRLSLRVRDARSAERLRREREAAYEEGRWCPWGTVATPGPAPQTLARTRDLFLAAKSHRSEGTRKNYERITGWLCDHLGELFPVANVTARHVEEWLDTTDAAPVTRQGYVRWLRVFFRFAVSVGAMREDPCPAVRLERVPRRFPKALTPVEVERVAACAEQHARSAHWIAPLVRFAAQTALRRAELVNLRWEHVELAKRQLTVACTDTFTTKSAAERRVPLSDQAVSILESLPEGETGYVFENRTGQIDSSYLSHAVKRYARKAGVEQATVHSFRHSAITWLIQRGVPVPVVQRFAGHADIATTMRYCSIADDVYAEQVRQALG